MRGEAGFDVIFDEILQVGNDIWVFVFWNGWFGGDICVQQTSSEAHLIVRKCALIPKHFRAYFLVSAEVY